MLQASEHSGARVYQGVLQPKSFPGLPEGWTSDWETFPSSDGRLQLFAVTHRPQADWKGPRALVVFHGMGEHGGRYLHFPHFLKGGVDAVFCMDHRGHGRSEGLRGHVDRFDLFAADAALYLRRAEDQLKKRFGAAEIHVLGHSMGGLIMLRALFEHRDLPVRSVTVSAPLLGIRVKVPAAKKAAGILLSRIWGSLHMATELDPSLLSHDKDVVEAYASDRLVHKKITPRMFTEMTAAMEDTLGRATGIEAPTQFLVPLQDQVVDPEATLGFFRALKLRDKQLRTYPGFFHEPFNEIGKQQAFEDLASWIQSH